MTTDKEPKYESLKDLEKKPLDPADAEKVKGGANPPEPVRQGLNNPPDPIRPRDPSIGSITPLGG